jgi:coproporphyrinogen III oxidase
MNVRYFELDNGTYWFGGGIDLTPHYVDETAARLFHEGLKATCDKFNPDFYTKFKPWADTYFHLPHRGESRGIGGIFFDHLDEKCGLTKEQIFEFCIAIGELFPILYGKQVELATVTTPTENELAWQSVRRGRYVEFNLLHDRGTKFGIYSGGRTESILMSMPPMAKWEYNYVPKSNSEEEKTLKILSSTIDWV